MKKVVLLLLSFYVALSSFAEHVSVTRIGETNPSTSAYVFGTGEQLSGQQFQTDGILTYKGYQYTVYYNLTRNVTIARRKMPVGAWEEVVLPYKNSVDDAHNVIVMGICANDGSIHLSYDHHNDPLHYCYSIAGSANDPENMPWEAASFCPTTSIMDKAVPDVTYPRFISKPDGNLLFECRFHLSGWGDSYLREYDANTKQWTLIGRYVQGEDVTPDACAYINGMTYDNTGKLHVTWCWRDDYGGGTNHDFYYAYSEDHGRTWKDTNGVQNATTDYMEPVVDKTTGNCLGQTKTSYMVEAIPYNRGYINQETQAVDSRGRIHAVNSHIPDGSPDDSNWASSRTKARLHHRFRKDDGTWVKRLITYNGSSINSYCRVSLSFDKYDNAYIIANGAEVYTASPDDEYANWKLLSAVDRGRFVSEPLVDRTLLMNNGVLSFVYLGLDKKITVIDYLTKNPQTPSGTGLLAEYFSDDNFTTLISTETVATPDQSTVPVGTNSIRWSGTFETLLGETYTLYVNTADKTNVTINDRLTKIINGTGTAADYDFTYTLIPSHKNNIVIESKTSSPVTLAWESANTTKENIPATSLYPEKANGVPGAATPPMLKGKVTLENTLMNEKKTINTTGKNVFTVTPFDPPRAYSLEVKTKINDADGRGMDIEARAKTGKGFRVSLDETSINWTSPLTSPEQIAVVDNSVEQVYRFAVADEKVHIYRDKEYIGTKEINFIKNIQADDTEAESAGTYGAETIGTWSGSGVLPTSLGWSGSTGSIPWNTSGGGVRFENVTHNMDGGGSYTGTLLTIRWDNNDYSAATYFYPVTLEANTSYEFSFYYEYWGSASTAQTMTMGISTSADDSGIYDSQSFTTAGTAQVLRSGKCSFTSKEAGRYYLTFKGSWAMFAIGNLSLKSLTYENKLQIGKNYEGGNADFEVFYVSYQEGAFAAATQDTNNEPELTKKQSLPTELQNSTAINAATDAKDVQTLSFTPSGDYSVEVSATVTAAEGRGLDIEARAEDGLGFRTSLNNQALRWIAPFSNGIQIATADNCNQVIRYAVQGSKVHVYQNGEYVDSFDVEQIGDMNDAGTEEISSAKQIGVNDAENKIANGDFAADAHGAAPTGWVAEKTMGSGTQSRVQQKEQTTELEKYPAGTKAFVFRFDNDENYGTWYSYPVTLQANVWYEYSFDIVAWGTNTDKVFNAIISTSQDGKSGIIHQEAITTPSVGKDIARKTVRFKTTTAGQYYLTFAKAASIGSVGATNLTLVNHDINGLLFGKNYTSGSANMQINYITVDYSGAFAPDGIVNDMPATKNDEVVIYASGNTLMINSRNDIQEVSVYDLTGKCLINKKCQSKHFSANLFKGIYIVKITTNENIITRKIIIG